LEPAEQNKSTCFGRASMFMLTLLLIFLAIMYFAYHQKNQQIIEFHPISTPIINPLMGWAPWASIENSNQPHTLVYADLIWRDFEPQKGLYDFSAFEARNQFDRWRQEGKRVVFRFIADKPGGDAHMDIPNWLFDAIEGDGEFYDNEYGRGFSPNYSNPLFIRSHKRAIEALGSRYGQDDFLAYVELGSLGHWGEWHIHSEIGSFPPEYIQNIYVSHYVEAFPDTHLLMRRPFAIARTLGLGLYNDMTGDLNSTTTWLEWIANGGEYEHMGDANALVAMYNGWERAPVGGEQAPSISDEEFFRDNLTQNLELLRKSHTTFIGPNGPYNIEVDGPLQDGVDQILSVLGYRIYIKQVQMPRWVTVEKNINVQIKFVNNGVAPIYYNWPVNIYLYNEDESVIDISQIDMDIREILPDENYQISIKLSVSDLNKGTYTLGIAIIDPQTKQPAVQLAMENYRQDFIYKLGSFKVIRLFYQ